MRVWMAFLGIAALVMAYVIPGSEVQQAGALVIAAIWIASSMIVAKIEDTAKENKSEG